MYVKSNLIKEQERITELFGAFAFMAKAHSAAGKTDFNKVTETVLIPLFKDLFNLPDLKNMNAEKQNYPAIDLADDVRGVAFQVTATADSQKIKDTLTKFASHKLYERYPRLIIYIITEKKDSYPEKAFAEIIDGKFDFSINDGILDSRDLIKICMDFQIDMASRTRRILEANFGRSDYSVFNEHQKEPFEEVFLNLVELRLPAKLFIADLVIDRPNIVRNSFGALKHDDPTRTVIRHYVLEQLKKDFFSGWHLHGNQLITFHDLHRDESFLSDIIDCGTIESITPADFYTTRGGAVDTDRENVFKSLLRKTLQEQLRPQWVAWQHLEHLFIFIENGNEKKTFKPIKAKKRVNSSEESEEVPTQQIIFKRYEPWIGEKSSNRAVLEVFMKRDKPDRPWYYKHRAFEAKFKSIGGKWFLLILPDWFFSFDGYHKSDYHADDVKWLKKNSNTGIVFTDFRFIHYFLKNEGNKIFHRVNRPGFLDFGDTVSFENAPFLFDEAWNPPELKKKKQSEETAEAEANNAKISEPTLFD